MAQRTVEVPQVLAEFEDNASDVQQYCISLVAAVPPSVKSRDSNVLGVFPGVPAGVIDFGQYRFRPISTLANFDFGQFLDVEFWDESVGPRRVGAPKGGGPNLEKVEPRRVEPRRVEPRRVEPRRVEPRRVGRRRVVRRRGVHRRERGGGPTEGPSEMGCRVRGFGFSSGFWGRKQKQNK